ncbi:hypothetical protein CKO15_00580 [Halorhodospira abdelmalekii]|nr:hypothetical protein [Halorhodospira abdelmalekii]
MRFNNLLHHITEELLEQAYYALNRHAASGVDGQDWESYGEGLRERLSELHGRIQANRYKPQRVKRVWLTKEDGGRRPIGITVVEDKVVQQAVVWVLEAIYENDFLGFSYGHRPGRSQHQALDATYVALMTRKVNWILDADIKGFYDAIDHTWMMRFMAHRIADKRMLRIVERTLKCGVDEDGRRSKTVVGTPQGAVLSPILGNIYLHYVLDLWAHQWRGRSARGEVTIVRYADDEKRGDGH